MVPSLVYHPVGGRHPITEQSGRFTKEITPGWRDHRARYTDANVQPLDGHTSQGTPCLMDEPQMKPCTSLGQLLAVSTVSTARAQSPIVRKLRKLRKPPKASDSAHTWSQLRKLRKPPKALKRSDSFESLRKSPKVSESVRKSESQGSASACRLPISSSPWSAPATTGAFVCA